MQEDLVMYFVVKESLNMSIGKTAAQVAHACHLLLNKYNMLNNRLNNLAQLSEQEIKFIERIKIWNNTTLKAGYKKVVLVAKDKDWDKIKQEHDHIVVIDAGLTEVNPNTETVIGLCPILKSERGKTLKRLQCLR